MEERVGMISGAVLCLVPDYIEESVDLDIR